MEDIQREHIYLDFLQLLMLDVNYGCVTAVSSLSYLLYKLLIIADLAQPNVKAATQAFA